MCAPLFFALDTLMLAVVFAVSLFSFLAFVLFITFSLLLLLDLAYKPTPSTPPFNLFRYEQPWHFTTTLLLASLLAIGFWYR